MIDLRGLVLDGLDLHLVRGTLPLPLLQCPLQSQDGVRRDGILEIENMVPWDLLIMDVNLSCLLE